MSIFLASYRPHFFPNPCFFFKGTKKPSPIYDSQSDLKSPQTGDKSFSEDVLSCPISKMQDVGTPKLEAIDFLSETLTAWKLVHSRIATLKRPPFPVAIALNSKFALASLLPKTLYIPTSYMVSAIARATFLHPWPCSLIEEYINDELANQVLPISFDQFQCIMNWYHALKNDNYIKAEIHSLQVEPSLRRDLDERMLNILHTRGNSSSSFSCDWEYSALTELVSEAKAILCVMIFQNACKISSLAFKRMARPLLAPLPLFSSGIPKELHKGIESLKGSVKTIKEARIVLLVETHHHCSTLCENMRRFMLQCIENHSIVLVEGVESGDIPNSAFHSLISSVKRSPERGIEEIGWENKIALTNYQLNDRDSEAKNFYLAARNISLISTMKQFPDRKIYIDLGLGHVYDPLFLEALHKEKVICLTFKSFIKQ